MPAPIELKPVESSMFSHVGYSEDMWVMTVVYKSSGLRLDYQDIPPEMFDEMMAAESLGKYFNKNIKGQYKAIGEDVAKQAGDAPLSEIDRDIQAVEPGWNGRTIVSHPDEKPEGTPAELMGLEPTTWPTYGGIDRSQRMLSDSLLYPDTSKMPQPREPVQNPDFGVKEFDPQTGHRPNSEVNDDGTVKESALARQTEGEVLAAWSAPESPAQALDMLDEHRTEIEAIIAQSRSTLADALTVKVTSQESRLEASEVLNRLVSKRDKTFALLDPFRAVLHAAYSEAGAKVKAGVEPLESGIRHVKAICLKWDQDAEKERQRLIREENERREAEARRLQQEHSAQLTLAEVNDALEAGDTQRAEELIASPIEVPRPYVQPTILPPAAPKVAGQSVSTTWKVDREAVTGDETGQAYIASITQMLMAVRDGKYPIEQAAPLLSWDFAAADKLAGALMSAFNVPGLTAAPVGTMRVGRGKRKKS